VTNIFSLLLPNSRHTESEITFACGYSYVIHCWHKFTVSYTNPLSHAHINCHCSSGIQLNYITIDTLKDRDGPPTISVLELNSDPVMPSIIRPAKLFMPRSPKLFYLVLNTVCSLPCQRVTFQRQAENLTKIHILWHMSNFGINMIIKIKFDLRKMHELYFTDKVKSKVRHLLI
jgi:hypothetical protein